MIHDVQTLIETPPFSIASAWRFCVDLGGLVESVGRAHIMVVHFPIALLLIAAGLDLYRRLRPIQDAPGTKPDRPRAMWRSPTGGTLLIFGALFGAITAGTGWIHAGQIQFAESATDTLFWHRWLGVGVAGVSVLTVVVGWVVRIDSERSGAGWVFSGMLLLTAGLVVPAGHFGGELVHGEGFMTAMFHVEHEDDSGAQTGSVVEIEETDSVLTAQEERSQRRAMVESKLEELRALGAHAAWVSQQDDLIEIDFSQMDRPVTDVDLVILTWLESVVVSLNLSGATLTEDSLGIIVECRLLERLRLENSTITDDGLAELVVLEELESLNLHQTGITDASIETLAALESLGVVYLWESGVTEQGIARLRELRPDLRVVAGP